MPCGRRRAWDRSWHPLASVVFLRLPGSVSLGVQVSRTPLPLPLSGTHGRCWYLKIASLTATGSSKQPSKQQLQTAGSCCRVHMLLSGQSSCARAHGTSVVISWVLGSFLSPRSWNRTSTFTVLPPGEVSQSWAAVSARLWHVVREAAHPLERRLVRLAQKSEETQPTQACGPPGLHGE